jgi:hypothetical protein
MGMEILWMMKQKQTLMQREQQMVMHVLQKYMRPLTEQSVGEIP